MGTLGTVGAMPSVKGSAGGARARRPALQPKDRAPIALTLRNYTERGVFYADVFEVFYGGDKLVAVSQQPLHDGARVLLDLGVDPDTLLTARHAGKECDLFVPRPLSEWAAHQPPTVPASPRQPQQALSPTSGAAMSSPDGHAAATGGHSDVLADASPRASPGQIFA